MKLGSFLLWEPDREIYGVIIEMTKTHWKTAWFDSSKDGYSYINLSEIDALMRWNYFWNKFYGQRPNDGL